MLDKVMFEEIIHPEKWINECYKELMEKEWNNEIERCRRHTERLIKRISNSQYQFPSECPIKGRYPLRDNIGWTEGFWTGINWLLFEKTGDPLFQQTAEKADIDFIHRIACQIITNHHDLGFLYSLSTVADYKITGNRKMKEASIDAAETLLQRFWEKAGVIQAWGDPSDPSQQGRMIMDCCMNLPLLYWASEETGNQKYKKAAQAHIQNAADYLVREDGSTYHTFYMDVKDGKPRYGSTHQGYSDNSCWARGQAWGIYGFALSYRYLKEQKYFDLSKILANYFMNRLPEDTICYWDLIFDDSSREEKDTSSMVIMVCGLLELIESGLLDKTEKNLYQSAVWKIMRQLKERYATTEEEDGFLTQSVYNKPKNNGVNTPCIWGDYYYLEALVRMTSNWSSYW